MIYCSDIGIFHIQIALVYHVIQVKRILGMTYVIIMLYGSVGTSINVNCSTAARIKLGVSTVFCKAALTELLVLFPHFKLGFWFQTWITESVTSFPGSVFVPVVSQCHRIPCLGFLMYPGQNKVVCLKPNFSPIKTKKWPLHLIHCLNYKMLKSYKISGTLWLHVILNDHS